MVPIFDWQQLIQMFKLMIIKISNYENVWRMKRMIYIDDDKQYFVLDKCNIQQENLIGNNDEIINGYHEK